jgi:hypothetical protein
MFAVEGRPVLIGDHPPVDALLLEMMVIGGVHT